MLIRIALTALLAAAACGSSASAPPVAGSSGHVATVASPAATTAQRTRAWLDYAACLRQHGADVPDPSFDQEGNPAWSVNLKSLPHATQQACASHLQGISGGKANQAPTAAELAKLTQFAQCVRQHGIPNFPDPDPNTGSFSGNFDKNSPGVQSAIHACQQFVPAGTKGQ